MAPDSPYAVADTSFYIEHEDKLEGIDFASLLGSAWPDKRVTLIVPVATLLADLLFDPPWHERLPIPADEILDRTRAVQGLTGTKVTLLTFDTRPLGCATPGWP